MEREVSASLHAMASNAARQLSEGLFSRAHTVEVLAASPELWVQGLDSPGVGALLNRARSLTPSNLWIGVADAEGTVRSATDQLLVGHDVSDRPWFEPGLQRVHVGDVRASSPRMAALLAPRPTARRAGSWTLQRPSAWADSRRACCACTAAGNGCERPCRPCSRPTAGIARSASSSLTATARSSTPRATAWSRCRRWTSACRWPIPCLPIRPMPRCCPCRWRAGRTARRAF